MAWQADSAGNQAKRYRTRAVQNPRVLDMNDKFAKIYTSRSAFRQCYLQTTGNAGKFAPFAPNGCL
jgi:hypothetical protein